MTYQDFLTRIYGLGRFGMKPGLERIAALLKALSRPQDGLRVIHVAGTNGKGSTAAFLSSILASAGHVTGLYTSPHLVSFTERIRINGVEIPEDEVTSLAERILSVAAEGTTFFEIVTAMAFLWFAEQGVGPAVMEVGMGGRLDATNAASGILSVITPIALDHCEHLGASLDRIAREKAGVIKASRPVVSSCQQGEAMEAIRERCSVLGSPLFEWDGDFLAFWAGDGLSYRGLGWNLDGLKPGIPGRYQAANVASALCAAELLDRSGVSVTADEARRGIEHASWPGRMEMFPGPPRILLDGAHNPAGAAALAESLRDIRRDALFLVIGVVEDKDVQGILSPLLPHADRVVAVTPSIPRGLPSGELAALCGKLGIQAEDGGSLADGLEMACAEARPGDLILVCGSLFIVGEARARLIQGTYQPFRG